MGNESTARKQESSNSTESRDGFSSKLGVIAATLGSAVGLGNIWKFPYVTGENGGASFIIVYLLSTLMVGLPIMMSEILLGRKAKANAIGTLRKLSPKVPWWLAGLAGVSSAFLILAFYTDVAGWVFAFVFKAVSGDLMTTDPAVTSKVFGDLVASPSQSLFWQWFVLILIGCIITMGVSKGIEKTTKRLMPILFIFLLIIGIRSLTLPGATEGLKFLFSPDFSKITSKTIMMAMGLSFFKLSIGTGIMITYGSYFGDDQNIPQTAGRVMLADLTVSILAGIAIFPAVFAFGVKPDAGPSLLFITIPTVFASMPLGQFFMVIFFALAAVASTGAMLSLMEAPVAMVSEELKISRKLSTLITVVVLGAVGSTAALSNSLLSKFKLFGMTMFDLFDFVTSNILMPITGILICVFVGWYWGIDKVKAALSNNGELKNEALVNLIINLVRSVSPLLVLLILLNGLGVI